MATTMSSVCVNTLSTRLHVRLDKNGIKKRKGKRYAVRSRDSLRRCTKEDQRDESKLYDYMDMQPDITIESRARVINWIIDTHNEYKLSDETLYLTVNIIDRFLATEVVCESELPIIMMTAMFIASKYTEIRGSAQEFVKEVLGSTEPGYERYRILDTEKRILMRLDWKLSVPTAYTYIMNIIKAIEKPLETEMENMVYFYAEMGMINYDIITRFDPLMVAASAIYGACETLDKMDVYETLQKHNEFKAIPVLECAQMIGRCHSRANDYDQGMAAIYEKYTSETRDYVATYSPASVLLRPTDR